MGIATKVDELSGVTLQANERGENEEDSYRPDISCLDPRLVLM